jgi:hypothetical protein
VGGRRQKCFGMGHGGGKEREKAASELATMSSSLFGDHSCTIVAYTPCIVACDRQLQTGGCI